MSNDIVVAFDSWLPIAAQLVDLPGELFDGVSKKFAIRCYAKYYAVQNKVPFVAAVTTTAMSNPGRVYVALTLHPVVGGSSMMKVAGWQIGFGIYPVKMNSFASSYMPLQEYGKYFSGAEGFAAASNLYRALYKAMADQEFLITDRTIREITCKLVNPYQQRVAELACSAADTEAFASSIDLFRQVLSCCLPGWRDAVVDEARTWARGVPGAVFPASRVAVITGDPTETDKSPFGVVNYAPPCFLRSIPAMTVIRYVALRTGKSKECESGDDYRKGLPARAGRGWKAFVRAYPYRFFPGMMSRCICLDSGLTDGKMVQPASYCSQTIFYQTSIEEVFPRVLEMLDRWTEERLTPFENCCSKNIYLDSVRTWKQ